MNEKELFAWCQRERATVWFGSKGWLGSSKGVPGVKIKVADVAGAIWGATLQDAIAGVEQIRRERAAISAAYRSLGPIDTLPLTLDTSREEMGP